jgi:hypothetical protein
VQLSLTPRGRIAGRTVGAWASYSKVGRHQRALGT